MCYLYKLQNARCNDKDAESMVGNRMKRSGFVISNTYSALKALMDMFLRHLTLPLTYFYQKDERILPSTLRAVSVFPCPECLKFIRSVNVTEHLHGLRGGSMGRPRSYERCGWK